MNQCEPAKFVSGDKVWWHRPGRTFQRVEATVMYRVGDKDRVKLKIMIMGTEYTRIAKADKLELIRENVHLSRTQASHSPLVPVFRESTANV